MRPLLGVDVAAALLLDPVVADGLGGVQRLADVGLVDRLEDLDALRVVGAGRAAGPHAGVAVGLELEPDRVAGRALLGADLAHRAEQVLDVVAVLVADDVGLHEVAALAAELALEHLVEERGVEVDRLVGRAVERARRPCWRLPQPVDVPPVKVTISVGWNWVRVCCGQLLGPVALQRQPRRPCARSPRSCWRPPRSGTARSGRSSRPGRPTDRATPPPPPANWTMTKMMITMMVVPMPPPVMPPIGRLPIPPPPPAAADVGDPAAADVGLRVETHGLTVEARAPSDGCLGAADPYA